MKKKPVIAILANYPTWLLCDQIPSRIGHYEVWHVSLHEAFANDDEFEIHRIILDEKVKEQIDFVDKGSHFHILPRTHRKIGLFTAYAMDRIRVARFLKQLKPDLLHAWGTEYSYGHCAMDFPGKKLFSLQGHLTAYAKRTKMSRFEVCQSLYEKSIFKAMTRITTESEWACDRILELAPNANIRIWEYAVEERFFSQKRELDDQPNCLLTGYNTPRKNIALAISAFSRPEMQHVKLFLAGTGADEFPPLPKNVIPLGSVARDNLVDLLCKTWCFLLPSFADTGPTAAKEARVVGVPVILTHDCGAKRYVEHGKSGFIISSTSEQQLVDAVLHVTQNKETALSMGLYNQALCRKALSSQTMIEELSKIYRDILND